MYKIFRLFRRAFYAQTRRIACAFNFNFPLEVFFKTLQSGCNVESLPFEEMSRLLPCLAVYVIISWRVLMIGRLGRSHPDGNCEVVCSPEEWKATDCMMHPKRKQPEQPPSLDFMIRLGGIWGGWGSTPGKKERPGPQTTWIGLQRVHDFATTRKTCRPDPKNDQKNGEKDKTPEHRLHEFI